MGRDRGQIQREEIEGRDRGRDGRQNGETEERERGRDRETDRGKKWDRR